MRTGSSNVLSARTLEYLFHHIFLPPKLPGGDDTSVGDETVLINYVLQTLSEYLQGTELSCHRAIMAATSMMDNMKAGRDDKGFVREGTLPDILTRILSPDTAAPFHIRVQNAGVLLRRDKDVAIFELFELSPTNQAVYATKGRLIRHFPATAISVPLDTFTNASFQKVLAKTMAKMSDEAVQETIPKARKAMQDHDESRETNDPRIVTELLSSFLQGAGHPTAVPGVSKNTREDVIWRGSKLPWRRSPVWLLIRCSLHLTMNRMAVGSEEIYKSFMVFLLSRLLRDATNLDSASETLKIMSTKVSRRLLKLQHPVPGTWLSTVHDSVCLASRLMNERWQSIRNSTQPNLDLEALSTLNMAQDVYINPQGLNDFISSISKRGTLSKASSFCPASDVFTCDKTMPSVPTSLDENSVPFVLAMVELWVAEHLDEWLENHLHDSSSCLNICSLMYRYHQLAKPWYSGRPEGTSRMVLVCLELWIAVDKVATNALPLLKEYEHEIPLEVLQALLLGFREDMERLHRAETYLQHRRDNARSFRKPSIFVSYGLSRSFPVEYFTSSLLHQSLLRDIELWAHTQRDLKREEFRRLHATYTELMRQVEQGACDTWQRWEHGIPYSEHHPYCSRCGLKSRAMNLSIQVHEWPLSSKPLEAQATVFELALPEHFGEWRDATVFIIDDLLQSDPQSTEESETPNPLRSYSALSSFFQTDPGLRVHLLSDTKPHVNTHRRDRAIGTSSEADVCVNNGLQLRYFDNRRQSFLDRFTTTVRLPEICTFQLSSKSVQMTRFLIHTHVNPAGETPNAVIASQSLCPDHMTLGEFKALATVRYGYRIHWMSVLTQLAMPEVDFNKPETALFFLQLSLQVGPMEAGTVERCAHTRLSDPEFGRELLEHLQGSVSRIRENWQSNISLWIVVFLAARLVTMTTQSLKEQALGLLTECRAITLQWLEKLQARAHESKDEDQRIQFLRLALRVSLICVETFNLDDDSLSKTLLDPRQAALLLEASINIYNNIGLLHKGPEKETPDETMYDRWTFTLHRARRILVREVLLNNSSCLDISISQYWPDFRRDADWHLVSSTCSWLETVTSDRKVHFNILSGSLLVDGSPLSRLPREYEAHHDFQRVFGRFVLDVMPSTAQGMRFCGCKTFDGYTVHFGMVGEASADEDDLLIRLEDRTMRLPTLDLVPSRIFNQSMPHAFAKSHVHWYNHATKSIEFCSTKDPWRLSLDNWTMTAHGGLWKLTRCERTSLVAPGSASAALLATVFSPLDSLLNLHILFDAESNTSAIEVPRLQLEFSLKHGESVIRSRQFRGKQIDANQSMETLVGFESKLILQDSHNKDDRMAIIPEGEISINRDHSTGHMRARVQYGTAHRVQQYTIDSQLRRLIDNATVHSKLFLAYIHALTSYCMPDPFLSRTGTEEALSILQSASIRSIDYLTEDSIQLLRNIAALTPSRKFYPEHLRSMQTVIWRSDLSFLTQDSRFYKIVSGIVNGISALSFLHPPNASKLAETTRRMDIDDFLMEREIYASSRYQVSLCGAEDYGTIQGIQYHSRDQGMSSCAALASQIAKKVHDAVANLQRHSANDAFVDTIYRLLSHRDGTPAARTVPCSSEMEYGGQWLQEPLEFLYKYWCKLHFAFQADKGWLNKYQAMIWLTTLAYSTKCDIDVLQSFVMLSLTEHLPAAPLPEKPLYYLAEGYECKSETLRSVLEHASRKFHDGCPEKAIRPSSGETQIATARRQRAMFESNKRESICSFVADLVGQWPCSTPVQPQQNLHHTYINVSEAMVEVRAHWQVWYDNYQFRGYLQEFGRRLSHCQVGNVDTSRRLSLSYPGRAARPHGYVSVDDLFARPPPIIPTTKSSLDLVTLSTTADDDMGDHKLWGILRHLNRRAKFDFERQYLSELARSLTDLENCRGMALDGSSMSMRAVMFQLHLDQCDMHVRGIYDALLGAILQEQGERNAMEETARIAGFWPRLSPTFFLRQLGRHRWSSLSEPWKKAIVAYGVAITALQQAQRLVQLVDKDVDLLREVQNPGHSWDPYQYPEWLLLECESGIMIRHVQHQIAEQMISPDNDENAVMQLNMGEGKSSVIVPIVATALSNGSRIVRVVVAKPQAKQMHQMLVSKLSGLIDRPIFRMPFSRAIRMDRDKAAVVEELARRSMREGGVMLVQPEHLLSFQLMGLECLIDGKEAVGRCLLNAQKLFDESSRDIVDESDENFSVKFELIYTMGLQQSIEHTPDRWVVSQEVLDRFASVCLELKSFFPRSLEIDELHLGRFPRIRILRPDAERAVLSRLARSICCTGITGLSIARQPKHIRDAVCRYITHGNPTPEEISAVEESAYWTDTTRHYILLLRGLFAGGILAFAFGQKRWRVDYGTDANHEIKTRLAVPFRAKDNPTQRSEFSHPDVVILLTCLSYYYSGLQDDELFETLDHLIRSDNADLEYGAWVRTAPRLPRAFQLLTGVNVRDRAQCIDSIFPMLRYSKGAIDYFLLRLVFAKESREFPHKLSASGWDLGKKKANSTTGFSGTNDSRYVLPLAVRQLDIPAQNHTNALVLEYLLRPENGIRLMSQASKGVTLGTDSLLEMVSEMGPRARVILDVGAQIIELDNLQFAQRWLDSNQDKLTVQAVVFFNDADELTVIDRSGKTEPLQLSPFASQLDQCLVFLDEAHTRGTDLRLPPDYQAAVTLGANLTKDKLVQACMRMRKLGKGQSVVFCIPREIEQKILMQRGSESSESGKITVSDVLCWTISETWLDLRRTVPLWLTQGVRFYDQVALWERNSAFDSSCDDTVWAKQFLEAEAQSLDFRYRPRAALESSQLVQRAGPEMMVEFEKRCQEFGLKELHSSSLQEEQERELSPETEREREVEPPPKLEPRAHSCHDDLVHFVEHGKFPTCFTAFRPAFYALRGTSAAEHFDMSDYPSSIWATQDFCETVMMNDTLDNVTDLFQRPVQWILTSSDADNVIDQVVIISPWEAHQLLGRIETSKMVTLHLYAPRTNFAFEPLDRLTLYTVPPRERKPTLPQLMLAELNIFAGQLYLSSFREYADLCDMLGLARGVPGDEVVLGPDGFIPPGIVVGDIINKSAFKKSPVPFLKVLMKIRRNCEAIDKTHMGKILNGTLLLSVDFDEGKALL
ncbi:hypothetical protein CCMA1212_009268 [Trichoderma ghanense]|uniref:ubiquitinyl hydrolase 1 n=1 Tax=Trichoderma ghanense TaxID=65468 RepID=A0ABY2GSJ2_9HYPO